MIETIFKGISAAFRVVIGLLRTLCSVIAGLCSLLPGWVWFVLLLVAFFACVGLDDLRLRALKDAAEWKAAIAQEKAWHERELQEKTAEVLTLTIQLNDEHEAQEAKDAEDRKIVEGLREDLRLNSRAAGGGGLRDPFATPCPRGGNTAAAPAAAGAVDRAADPTEAGGLLSAELEGLLLRLQREADEINIAYASCRPDALTLRETFKKLSPLPGPASTGPP